MPHMFTPREEGPQPEAGGNRRGAPPLRHTAAAVLDPPGPPRRPIKGSGATPAIPHPTIKILALLILLALVAALLVYLWK
jgi:hypothetical protein